MLARCLLAAVALAVGGPAFAAEKRPNIVFIFSDDHAYQAISAYGHAAKLLDTPNIDRVAKDGMRFDRCLVTNSICGPSRATIMTGKYSHANGFYDNTYSRFDGAQTTFPGQGVYYNPPMIKNGARVKHEGYVTDLITDFSLDWLKNRHKDKPFLLMCQHKAPHREWSPALRHLGHDKDRKYPEPDTLFDDYAGRGAAEKGQDMTIAKTMNAVDLKFKPPGNLTPEQKKQWDAYYDPRNKAFEEAKLEGKDLVRWKLNRYMHDYLGCIKAVDESVGRLLDYLDKEGLAENTIVVYASDQGFYLGEHGWFDKRWIFEESLRTPFLVRWPGVTKPGSVDNHLVSNLDFAETFLDAAGAKVPEEMQGKSLRPILKGESPADWRKSFYYHYYEFPGPHSVRRHYGVVTDQHKLVHFYESGVDYWELFDRKADPKELTSFYGKADYVDVQKELKAELDRLRKDLKVPETDPPETLPKKKEKKE
jgi:arylsulfatase A-like enzyme